MRKLKGLFAVIAALLVVLLGAWMPRLVARRQDSANENRVLFAPVEEVELVFAQTDMPRRETLAILRQGRDMVQIPEDLAALDRERVEKTLAATAQKYMEEGLLPTDGMDLSLRDCQTVLVYGREGRSNIFWLLSYADPEGKRNLTLTVDDRSGAVCAVEYTDQELELSHEQMEPVFEAFIRLYLAGLGEEFYDYPPEELLALAKRAEDGSYIATELFWELPGYGGNTVTFFVNRSGFYTYFG